MFKVFFSSWFSRVFEVLRTSGDFFDFWPFLFGAFLVFFGLFFSRLLK